MGHTAAKDVYRQLGKKIDNLTMRAPWNETLFAILKELCSPEEAEVVVKMPYGLSNFGQVAGITKYEKLTLRKILESLCSKGFVIDVWINDAYYYMPSPIIIGVFELTMMRTGDNLNTKKWAELFHEYMHGDDSFYAANCKNGEQVTVLRALPHEEAIGESEHIEVLDYEKATAIVDQSDKIAIGLCSCRHEKLHIGKKECDVPLDTCSSFGWAADYAIRNNFADEVSKSEMLDNLARSKEMGLVLHADNVRKNITCICQCCKCCCTALLGISKFGYPNTVITSSFIAENNEDICEGCGKCAKACPINAIELVRIENPTSKKRKNPRIDTSICLGCGVCALKCDVRAVELVKREKRVIHPETTFERVILQCLERGTLQNQLFKNPQSITHKFMRGLVGGFIRLSPVKKSLMSNTLRSSFLSSMKVGVKMQGKGWITEM